MKALYKLFLNHCLSCKDATRLVSESRERKLTCGEKFKLKLLCMLCPFTARYQKQVQAVCNTVHDQENCCEKAVPDKRLCDEAKRRIKAAVEGGN